MAMHVSNSDDVSDDDKILRLRDVEAIVGLKRSTIYRKILKAFSCDKGRSGSSVVGVIAKSRLDSEREAL